MPGLIYDPTDSRSVMDALTSNLAAARSTLSTTSRATRQLVAAVAPGGPLSGKAYAAAGQLFSRGIAPRLATEIAKLDAIQADLDKYTVADAKVSRLGVLDEDALNIQLTATQRQRDATERLVETNRAVATATPVIPGLSDALQSVNDRLELVLNQLVRDVRELEDRLKALHTFDSDTRGLFAQQFHPQPVTTATPAGSKPNHSAEQVIQELTMQFLRGASPADWVAWAKKNGYSPQDLVNLIKKMTPQQRDRLTDLLAGMGPDRFGLASWLFSGAKRGDVDWLHDHFPELEPGLIDGTRWKQWSDIDVTGRFSPEDINQGAVNDCWWIGTLAAYANTPEGEKWLKDHIRANPNGTFTVTLYVDGKPVEVTVTDYFPASDKESTAGNGFWNEQNKKVPNWASIYEKARAALPDTGSYDNLSGGWSVVNPNFGSGGAMGTLTGDEASWITPSDPITRLPLPGYQLSDLRKDLSDGRPVTVTTYISGRTDMVDFHQYTVTSVNPDSTVTLRNPWGQDASLHGTPKPEYLHLTFDELQRAGFYINIGAPIR
jgi:hypothetical protein